MLEARKAVEFIQSRTGSWVPLLDGKLLHSSIHPEKEAAIQIEVEWNFLCEIQSIIVLGLGGGFHIDALLNRKDFHIVVVEANRELTQEIEKRNPKLMERIDVLAGIPTTQLNSEVAIQCAFSRPFAVFKHPASFHQSSYYYSSALKVLNLRTLEGLKKLAVGNSRLCRFLESLDIAESQFLTLPMVEEAMMRRGTGLDREGLIWMALRELIV